MEKKDIESVRTRIHERCRLYMPEITEDELVAHIEDDDFFLVYGNPVLIRAKDGRYDCVLMSIGYYNRRKRLYEEQKEKLSATIAHTVPAEKDPGGKHETEK